MVSLFYLVRVLVTFDFAQWRLGPLPSEDSKSIAIVGAGSAGLAALKTLLDLPPETRRNWDITLYEEREDVGGIWLPDPHPIQPPDIPYTGLYPLLRTNTPVPSMTYPGFPFPPNTPLFPSHDHVESYHVRYAAQSNLLPHVKFHHKVLKSQWFGNSRNGVWKLTLIDDRNQTVHKAVDHLIVASGNHHIPRIPSWPGLQEWLEQGRVLGRPRQALHSVYYRRPEEYKGRVLLVIGSGSSGQDAAMQTIKFTQKTYLSARHDVILPPGSEEVVIKPDISHFTLNGVVFVDGTELHDVDSVLLATGYEQRKSFLESGNALVVDPSAHSNSSFSRQGGALVTNLRYIFPLHEHILSLSPTYPVNALAFIGLPTGLPNCPSNIAQSLFVAHAIANPSILPSREVLLQDLAGREDELRNHGYDPYQIGHLMALKGSPSDYQDRLVDFLKRKKAIPDNGRPFVEQWRREIFDYAYLKRGWKRIEALGEGKKWLKGVETEEQWSNLMRRINAWQQEYERREGIPFVQDMEAPLGWHSESR